MSRAIVEMMRNRPGGGTPLHREHQRKLDALEPRTATKPHRCRAAACDRTVAVLGEMCESCHELYYAQR